ncbi:hypothetical protein GUITHDRAFT_116106 [Guillardia theta CCMP2712]|uniref:Methyltransferase type 11 domain-containing protein n=1 Tax=Guillardia theta (strain CCMP2712) TaxID=905079 RepID=L1IPL5_GUITC|nr:hypothetical protein GUITHDRAFT_116106 [Guillardia theta CCMP2712]EKX37799.1 hypothetical protein GUITHDRAFT_116106 [Guillardia theta CCMP2712]|eukprot:XP_005824779.1 hypothetical protein GUITHDRAFT_116106 [Guillardia theta CCMP2712]
MAFAPSAVSSSLAIPALRPTVNHRSRFVSSSSLAAARRSPILMMATETSTESVAESTGVYACTQCSSPISLEESECRNCGAAIKREEVGYVDLTPESMKKRKVSTSSSSSSDESSPVQTLRQLANNPLVSAFLAGAGAQMDGQPLRQELFRTPVVSWLYERGWRAGFASAGFPGIEKEYELVMDFFQEARNKTVVDLSCGSGLMVRRLAKSRAYSKAMGERLQVIAVDYSENMLGEVIQRKKEENCPDFDIIRADVASLPFVDGSLDAIHSGAALHCWPYVQDGLKEVHRVLKPGGRFFASTFLWGVPDEVISLQANLGPRQRQYRFFSVEELEWLMRGAGFKDVNVERRDRCALIRCRKEEATV